MIASIAGDLNKTPQGRLKGQRYLTLTHFYNGCVDPAAMEAYRQGAVKLLNSLSRSSDVVKLETIDPQKTILRFNLIDLGWEDADWTEVIAAYPYKVKPDDKLFGFLTQATGDQLPFVRADWFGFTASQPDLYNKLLKLPADFKALQTQQGLNVDANITKSVAQRAGAQSSGVSQNNRIIERHPIRTGYFWTTYDFAGTRDRQNIFSFPVGPSNEGFKHDGTASMFSLPNGFLGYFLADAAGTSINKSPTNILRDPSRSDLTVTNGISCMGCHDQGIKPWRDEIRQTVLADRTSFPKAVRDAVESLYPPADRMDALLADDTRRFRGAMERAGLNPNLKWNGIEVIASLAVKYENPVDLTLVAAELGMKPDELRSASQGSARANQLMRRLAQGPVPRDQFEGEFARLVPEVTPDEVLELKAAAAGGAAAGARRRAQVAQQPAAERRQVRGGRTAGCRGGRSGRGWRGGGRRSGGRRRRGGGRQRQGGGGRGKADAGKAALVRPKQARRAGAGKADAAKRARRRSSKRGRTTIRRQARVVPAAASRAAGRQVDVEIRRGEDAVAARQGNHSAAGRIPRRCRSGCSDGRRQGGCEDRRQDRARRRRCSGAAKHPFGGRSNFDRRCQSGHSG